MPPAEQQGTFNVVVNPASLNLNGILKIPAPAPNFNQVQYTVNSDPSKPQLITPTLNGGTVTFVLNWNNVAYTFTGSYSSVTKKYSGSLTWPNNPDGTDGSWTAST